MTELAELHTFVTVATSGSFAAAARQLALSPAMVGRRIQALERRFGVKLIERTTRSHRLTATGQEVLTQGRRVLEAMEELEELVGSDETRLGGRVRASAPTTLGITRIAGIVARFSEHHPGLAIELVLEDRRVDLIGEGFDLAVRIGELPSSSLIARRSGSYGFVCCASPDHLERHGTPHTPAELERARCVLNLNLVPRNRWPFVDPSGERFGVEVRGSIEIDNGEAMRAAACAGAGVIYAPRELVASDLADGALVAVLPGWRTMTLPIHVVYPSRALLPRRVAAVVEAVVEGLRD